MRADTVVGYTFNAETLCPSCTVRALPTGPGERFDGWDLVGPHAAQPVEQNLDELSIAFGIEREKEHSFDSGYFPKVVFADSVDTDERCDRCHEPLIGD